MIQTRTISIISFFLGILSVIALLVSHLALTDIWHGEGDLRLEWSVLQAAAMVIVLFQVFALVTIGRFLRRKE